MSEKKNRRERRQRRGHNVTLFLKGIWSLSGRMKLHPRKTHGSNLLFSLWSVNTGRSMSLQKSTWISMQLSPSSSMRQQVLKNTLACPRFLFPGMLPKFSFPILPVLQGFPLPRSFIFPIQKIFKFILWYYFFSPPEAFLQQVTLPCSEFTEWALSLSCLIYFCESIN